MGDLTPASEPTPEAIKAAGLKKVTAYVPEAKKRSGSAERMARKRERDAGLGIVTTALTPEDQQALDLGRKVLELEGVRGWLTRRWLKD